jgi:hypothetical protein
MSLCAFLLLPTEDTIPQRIKNQIDFEVFVKETISVIRRIRRENSMKLYYDEDNFKAFFGVCGNLASEGTYLNSAKYQMQSFLGVNAVNIATAPHANRNCVYFLWNYPGSLIVDSNIPKLISEIAERMFSFKKNTNYLLLNMWETVEARREVLLVFKDAPHIKELPSGFARIPFIANTNELEQWLKTNHVQDFSLQDRTKFRKTNRVEQGQSVYLETETNHYWYLDNLHKDEYEVFDSTGKHIGVAGLNGEIDYEKRETGRSIEV